MEQQQLWVGPVGRIIVARLRGAVNEVIIKECQEQILALVKATGRARVLYDTLEMEVPAVELLLLQQKLDLQTTTALDEPLRKAILVPDTRLAYRARIAFSESSDETHRVFYNDLAQAIRWLEN